eukprot:scaffold86495_cov59-Attheya_sp.AAC.7
MLGKQYWTATALLLTIAGCVTPPVANAFSPIPWSTRPILTTAATERRASVASTTEGDASSTPSLDDSNNLSILKAIREVGSTALEWAGEDEESQKLANFYALFRGIRENGLSTPFYITRDQVSSALHSNNIMQSFAGFYTMDNLAQSLQEDFLDASRGSTDNRKGWKSSTVSSPRGNSFEEARMTLDEVNAALEKGTVIFNSAGAHIGQLAGPCLACADASGVPPCLNVYVTAPHKRTSAPPHTDKQDVVVIQTSGAKHWRVYSPPDPSLRPTADRYARGKGDDNLPLHLLESVGCELLLDVTLTPGDILYIPAAFPHTTDTMSENMQGVSEDVQGETSFHLTIGMDTHVWDLDYLSARRMALRRANVPDTALGQAGDEDNKYVGNSNLLPSHVDKEIQEPLPFGLLEEDDDKMVEQISLELERRSRAVDEATASAVPSSIWKETVERLRISGMGLLDIHMRMFTSAVDEDRARQMEAEMAASLGQTGPLKMTPERMQRLSCFRVPPFFEEINAVQQALYDWSSSNGDTGGTVQLPDNWEFTLPLKLGDEVEADLGGAMFPAKISRVVGDQMAYDVQFFDGDQDQGLERSMIKLLKPPAMEGADGDEEKPPPGLTPKELKRWKKKQDKKKKK